MKKTNYISNKKLVIYANKNLIQTIKNIIEYKVIVITPVNIGRCS